MISPLRHTPLLPGTLKNLFFPPPNYTYFERAGAVPFENAATVTKAAWAADASMLVYARKAEVQMTDQEVADHFRRGGLETLMIGGTPENWNAHGTQAVFASGDKFAILAFRGSELLDPLDAVSDTNIVLFHEPDYRPSPDDPLPALGHLSFVSHLFTPPVLVHRGFQTALNQVWTTVHHNVMSYRRNHPQAEICFTGHSLGGALAVLAFSRFADPNISLYTFGCPRAGDAAFRDRVLSNPGRGIFRYVNFNDAITHVPGDSLLYRQTPDTCYRFAEDGNLLPDDGSFKGDVELLRAAFLGLPGSLQIGDLDTVMAPPSVVDHSPARYCYRLWDCV